MSLGVLTADFLFSIEKRMKVLNELGYMNLYKDLWYPKVVRSRNFEGKSERLIWLLDTASIEQVGVADGGENAGSVNYEEMSTVMVEYFPAYHRKATKIGKLKMLNMMAGGLDPLGKWAGAIGRYGSYYPQRLAAIALLFGGNAGALAYDGLPFFSTAHLVHPNIAALGTFANVFTGGSSGSYPGACPIDDSVALDTAMTNLSKIIAYITGAIPQPNGAGDPRLLTPKFILYPPRMQARVEQLMNADFIAQIASSGAGSGDIRAVLRKFRSQDPVKVPEIDAARSYTFQSPTTGLPVTVTGDNKTFYVVCEEADTTELGALVENKRLPFTLHTYSGENGTEGIDAVLGRSTELEYLYDGATAVNYGHPYAIFQCKGS